MSNITSEATRIDVPNPWVSVMDKMPPVNTWVETMGAEEGCIITDYFDASFGDWINNYGDPTHWRFLANVKGEPRHD